VGEFNIFILTNDPAESFDKVHQVVTNEGVSNVMRSAYRESGWCGLSNPLAVISDGIPRLVEHDE
jgi:hypothetical protein